MALNFLPEFMDDRRKGSGQKNPAGEFTNDIFDIEERRRNQKVVIYEDGNAKNKMGSADVSPKCHETEDIVIRRENSNLRRSLSDSGSSKLDGPSARTPPLATGKENIGTHFKKGSPAVILTPTKKMENDDEEPTLPMSRNPITGEGIEESSRNKLEDKTNLDIADAVKESSPVKAPRRPCIRVRQPPGGKSSIVF